ncbi:MAG: hypothetical protein KA715_07560 [Xanthomonadaceae bacterium]|nr:hypothetical protein [Xanthomonadaceae bacterium]
MSPKNNIHMLEMVAKGLGKLKDEVVFVGGAVTSLYIDDKAAPPVTASDDIDCVIQVASMNEYAKIEKILAKQGFKRPVDEEDQAIICRWDYFGILVDVMPTDEKILGFTNIWYSEAIKNKMTQELPNGTKISIFTLPYFVATKLEAFKGRGENDWRMSQDFEDIISVLDGCTTAEEQLKKVTGKLKTYFKKEFSQFTKDESHLREAVEGFLRPSKSTTSRSKKVIQLIHSLT